MFSIIDNPMPNIYLLEIPKFEDERGIFLKGYNKNDFSNLGINFSPKEQFFTCSKKNVLRGMHFQIEEFAHDKLVYCPLGKVLDVIVDVRTESKYYDKPYAVELSDDKPLALFIGKGYAHGFFTKRNDSWLHYHTSTTHNPNLDMGIHWKSISFNWPVNHPLVSNRDSQHPKIGEINCKFY